MAFTNAERALLATLVPDVTDEAIEAVSIRSPDTVASVRVLLASETLADHAAQIAEALAMPVVVNVTGVMDMGGAREMVADALRPPSLRTRKPTPIDPTA